MRKKNITNGTTYVMFAYAACVALGYAIHTGLIRLAGHLEYSIYAPVILLITIVTLIFTTGIPKAVSRYVAHYDEFTECIKSKTIKVLLKKVIITWTKGDCAIQ